MGSYMTKIGLLIFCSVVLVGCGKSADMRGADFSTLGSCLEGIRRNSSSQLKIITDKPDLVSGQLSNGQAFGCEMKTSGTKGVYFEGWYMVN